MKRFYEAALLLIGTLGWWGFVYPELSAVTETYVQEDVQEEDKGEPLGEPSGKSQGESGEEFWQESYREVTADSRADSRAGSRTKSNAESQKEPQNESHGKTEGIRSFAEELIRDLGSFGISSGDVRIKSRIAEYLYQEKEKGTTEKESGYEEQKRAHRGV